MQNHIDYDNIHTFKYLDAVVSETLRLYPPATSVEREASEDYLLGDAGIKVPKNTVIHIATYSLHRDPQYFNDPEKFMPERFLAENRTHDPFAYLPFGAGPRNCVGMRLALMECKLALMHAVHKFKFTLSSNTKVTQL